MGVPVLFHVAINLRTKENPQEEIHDKSECLQEDPIGSEHEMLS